MVREPNINENWTIFNSLYEDLQEKENKKLRLAKCAKCGRATPYRVGLTAWLTALCLTESSELTAIRCKKCGTYVLVRER